VATFIIPNTGSHHTHIVCRVGVINDVTEVPIRTSQHCSSRMIFKMLLSGSTSVFLFVLSTGIIPAFASSVQVTEGLEGGLTYQLMTAFKKWSTLNGKVYKSHDEKMQRLQIWVDNNGTFVSISPRYSSYVNALITIREPESMQMVSFQVLRGTTGMPNSIQVRSLLQRNVPHIFTCLLLAQQSVLKNTIIALM
jgi:hypothetical protein